MKRFFPVLVFVSILVGLLTAANTLPNATIEIMQKLPDTMNVGEVSTVIVKVTSDQEFLLAQAMPSFAYPGKGIVAVQGGDRAVRGTSALLEIPFEAKSSTAKMEGGAAPVYVVVGVRYAGGIVAVGNFTFYVRVP